MKFILNLCKNLFECAFDFNRLEKIEFGGVEGVSLSHRVLRIFKEFKTQFEKLSLLNYEPLDPECEVNEYNSF